jgi:hypothetical protein
MFICFTYLLACNLDCGKILLFSNLSHILGDKALLPVPLLVGDFAKLDLLKGTVALVVLESAFVGFTIS